MLAIIQGLRDIVLADPYFAAVLAPNAVNKVHTKHISEVGQAPKAAPNSQAPAGQVPLFPCITLQILGGYANSWDVFMGSYILQVNIWGQRGYSELMQMYEDQSDATIATYGCMRGLKPLFNGQKYKFSGITVVMKETFCQNVKDATNNYSVVARYRVWYKNSKAANIISTLGGN